MKQKKEYYSVLEAAKYLGKHPSWVYQLIQAKQLPHIKVGSFYMIAVADLRRYKRSNSKRGVK